MANIKTQYEEWSNGWRGYVTRRGKDIIGRKGLNKKDLASRLKKTEKANNQRESVVELRQGLAKRLNGGHSGDNGQSGNNEPKEEWRTTKSGVKYKENRDGEVAHNMFMKARESQADDKKWRVYAGHSPEEFGDFKNFETEKGSVCSVTEDGDIVSVCANASDPSVRGEGKKLLEIAVENGGKKLDSYDGNWDFYCKYGFEPVSWCRFNEDFMDGSGWEKTRDKPEDIVFFRYTGKPFMMDIEEWKEKNPASEDYDEAQRRRDNLV